MIKGVVFHIRTANIQNSQCMHAVFKVLGFLIVSEVEQAGCVLPGDTH